MSNITTVQFEESEPCTELNWAGCAQFSTGTPKATNCAEHEFFAGPLLKQSEAFREHPVESKALLQQLVTARRHVSRGRAGNDGSVRTAYSVRVTPQWSKLAVHRFA